MAGEGDMVPRVRKSYDPTAPGMIHDREPSISSDHESHRGIVAKSVSGRGTVDPQFQGVT